MASPRTRRRKALTVPIDDPVDFLDYDLEGSSSPAGPTRNNANRIWSRPGGWKDDLSTWTVTDDWPERVPVTSAEVDVFEAWFGDVFDELFGPCE